MKHVIRAGCAAWLACAMWGCSSSDTGADTSGDPNAAGSSGSGSTAGSAGGSGAGGQGTAGSSTGASGSIGGGGGGAGGRGGGSSGASGAGGGSGGGGPLSFMCADAPADLAAPAATWVNATGNLANMPSECGNLGLVSANPCSTMVMAGVAQAGLWGTQDGGKSWAKLGTGAGSATITNRNQVISYDPAHPGTFWEAGIYNGGGVYETIDNGQTFKQVGNISHTDSVSIDFSDPERKTLLAGFHETTGKVWKSTDGGTTWTTLSTLPGGAGYCTATLVVSATNLLVGCAGGGVYHSTDGNAWNQVGNKGVAHQPLLATDGTVYWPGTQGGLQVSTDHGASFAQIADGNFAAADSVPAELPDGRIVVVGKDHLQISSDKGGTWKPIGDPLPYGGGSSGGARGLTYSARTKTFYVYKQDCGNVVLPNAIMSAGFDYMKQ